MALMGFHIMQIWFENTRHKSEYIQIKPSSTTSQIISSNLKYVRLWLNGLRQESCDTA